MSRIPLSHRLRAAARVLTNRAPGDLVHTLGRSPGGTHELNLTRDEVIPVEHLGSYRTGNSLVGTPIPWLVAAPVYPRTSIRRMRRDGFRNPTMYSCIDAIGKAVRQARLMVVDEKGHEVEGHPMLALFEKRTNMGGTAHAMTSLVQDLYSAGNNLWEIVYGKESREPLELWDMDPSRVYIERGKAPGEWIRSYALNVGAQWAFLPPENVLHWQFPDPDDEGGFWGIPPAVAAARHLTVDNELADQLTVTLQNRAVPTTVLESSGDLDMMKAENVSAARERFKQQTTGARRGEPIVLPQGMKVTVIGMSWKDMALDAVAKVPESQIARVHGVPMLLLSPTQDPTFANYEQAKEHFWTDTILPLLTAISEILTMGLVRRFKGSETYRADFDVSAVPVLRKLKLSAAETASKVFSTGLISRHQGQKLAGVATMGPDVFYRPISAAEAIPADEISEGVPLEGEL